MTAASPTCRFWPTRWKRPAATTPISCSTSADQGLMSGGAGHWICCSGRGEAMTESDWLAGTEPRWMLEYLGRTARSRKLRLFACACARRAWHRIKDPVCRQAVETAERFADRQASNQDR